MTEQCTQLDGAKILLGITGGIAAYKSADLASKLTGAGAAVRTIMTENACQLIGPATLRAVTGQPVYTTLWTKTEDFRIGHIQLRDWADVVVIAPASANIIGKLASGICDDLLTTTMCACWDKKVLIAPAMNNMMWANPIVQRNMTILTEQLKFKTVGPATGHLACGTTGIGRMAEPADILTKLLEML